MKGPLGIWPDGATSIGATAPHASKKRASRWLQALMTLLLLCCAAAPACAADDEARVLMLYGLDPYLPPMLAMDKAMRASLASDAAHPVQFFFESLDSQRFSPETVEPELAALLAKKYGALRINVVVAVSRTALLFFERHGAKIWPGARVVFVGFGIKPSALPPDGLAVVSILDAAGTIAIARRLQPGARRIVVVSGVSDVDRSAERQAREALAKLDPEIPVEYLSGLPLPELVGRVAAETPDSIVVYLAQFRDRDGRPYETHDVLRAVVKASRAPVYGAGETYIGLGAVAGSVASYESRGRLVADQVRRALTGKPIDPGSTVVAAPNACAADARALERWSLDEGRLPDRCDLRFANRPLWRQYSAEIAVALTVIAAQAALIGALVFQLRRRRAAERESQARSLQVAHMNRRVALGEMSASIAHELNQPLGAIRNNASAAEILIKADPPRLQDVTDILADIQRDDQRASDIIKRIRRLLRNTPFEVRDMELNETIQETLQIAAGEATAKEVVVRTELEPGLPKVSADRVQLQQVILNLVLNGIEAMNHNRGRRKVLTVRSARVNGREAEISVADSGSGIPEKLMPGIFDPFVSTKPGGMGMGLAISRSIIEAHGGRIRASNAEQGGAVFRFTVPLAEEARA